MRFGLIRVPYYPQLNCLNCIDVNASAVMSVLLFWLTKSREPSYCPKHHHYKLAVNLDLELKDVAQCFDALCEHGVFVAHEITIAPKVVTEDSVPKVETRYSLDLNALQQLLASLGTNLSIKLLKHAADDSFDFYGQIEEKFLPRYQILRGYLSGSDFEKASLLLSKFAVFVNEYCEEFAIKAIAPGWKLLLQVPMDSKWDEYASELNVRFLRPSERAFDFSFTDGNFFLPDYAEHQALEHITKHYKQRDNFSVTLCAAMMLLLQASFEDKLTYVSEISVSNLKEAIELLCTYDHELAKSIKLKDDYYTFRELKDDIKANEKELFDKILQSALTMKDNRYVTEE